MHSAEECELGSAMQEFVNRLPSANHYCSDGLAVYQELMWPQGSEHIVEHIVSKGKEQTHDIESLNAELRTYLGRLKRRSRCFSRSWEALARAVRLFTWHYNKRRRVILQHQHMRHALPLLL